MSIKNLVNLDKFLTDFRKIIEIKMSSNKICCTLNNGGVERSHWRKNIHRSKSGKLHILDFLKFIKDYITIGESPGELAYEYVFLYTFIIKTMEGVYEIYSIRLSLWRYILVQKKMWFKKHQNEVNNHKNNWKITGLVRIVWK